MQKGYVGVNDHSGQGFSEIFSSSQGIRGGTIKEEGFL